jgi:hypothetical protein
MPLRYDYDIHWIVPREIGGDTDAGDAPDDSASAHIERGNYRALFRDPATAQALRDSDPRLQEYFTASGFGFTTHDSGAPEGCFPAEDLAARNDVIERLTENLSVHDLNGVETTGFSFDDFIAYEVEAQPVDMPPADKPEADTGPDSAFGGLLKRAFGLVRAS